MEKIRLGIIGMGNMGCKYAAMIASGSIPEMELKAVTRVKDEKLEEITELLYQRGYQDTLPVFQSADTLFEAVREGKVELDAVLIATPHYLHQEQSVSALQLGLHVLCDKPAGVYSRQAREMQKEASKHELVFAMIFNQRTNPIYAKMKELVESGIYGKLKRVNWVVTDWYRPDRYYKSGSWRATWEKDGGGILLNQCPHNLDLLQWICGMPVRVQAFCHEGKYHSIEVEDEVTAYLEFEEGATGVFFSSTGEAPGINRLEISLEDALLVCEGGELKVCELGFHEPDYRKTATDCFKKLTGQWHTIECPGENSQYIGVLQNFADAVLREKAPLAKGAEGKRSLLLSNALYLSSWQRRMVEIPAENTDDEREFEQLFEEELKARIEKTKGKNRNQKL